MRMRGEGGRRLGRTIRLLAGDVIENTAFTIDPPAYWLLVRRTVEGVEKRYVEHIPIDLHEVAGG